MGTILAVILLSAALVVNMITVMNFLSYTILNETMRPMARTASLALQGNLHMLADRIFLVRDNDVFTKEDAGVEEKQRILDKAASGIEFSWLGLYSTHGTLETGTTASPERLRAFLFLRMQVTNNLVINDIEADESSEPEIIIGAPVFSGGTIINYIVGSYKYDILSDVIGNLHISLNSKAYIINDSGKFMAHSDISRVKAGKYIFTDYPPGSEMDNILEHMKEGQIDSVRMGSGISQKIFAHAPIRGTRWVMVIEVPWKDFFAPIQGGIIFSLSIIIIMMLLFTIAANFFISRIIVEPLKIITESAQYITQGIFARPIPDSLMHRYDEIGKLSGVFLSMSKSIKDVIDEIEQIAHSVGSGRLYKRMEFSAMEGDFYKIVSLVNSAVDVICTHLDAIPVALALFNENKEMLYSNYAMSEFLLMHEFEDHDSGFLDHIAGSGGLTGQTLDSRAQAIFDPAIVNPEPFVSDIALLGPEGGTNYTLTIQRTGLNTGSNSVCVILMLNDVTLLTRAKIDAEAASHAKSDFLSRMSHEIRTPMNAVIGMTQIAKSTDDIGKIHSCLEQVENSSNHLLGVINDILDFSKIESGKLILDISDFSLTRNLDFVISMMIPKAREREINLRLSIDNVKNDGLSADSLRLNQVLINLISNAIKFSPKDSEILVKVRELGSEYGFSTYRFEVIDHGIGISEYQASKLFRPFEQADGSITRNYGGTGLGLVICRNLVEMMGGKITLDSREGEGSTFAFTILCASKPAIEETEENRDVVSTSGNYDFSGKRCLVVDDIDINREIILELLSETNLAMEISENGQEAVDKFRKGGAGYFDIILMDMQMPVMDGCTATREIRSIEKKWAKNGPIRETSIVAMTANVMQEDIQKAIDSGMNAHLGKPIELETTLRMIHEQLSGHD